MTIKNEEQAQKMIQLLQAEHTAILENIQSNKDVNRELAKTARRKMKLWKSIEAEYKINGGE